MTCGELTKHTNKRGALCGQIVAADAVQGCLWHSRSATARSLMASKGPAARRKKLLVPVGSCRPQFESRASIIQFVQDLAHRVLTTRVDPRRIDSALRAAGEARAVLAAAVQEKILDALLKIEYGETALLMLTRLQEGMKQGARRPLPARVVTIGQGENA